MDIVKGKTDKNSGDVFDIKNTFANFLNNWKLFLLCVVVFTFLGFLFTKYVTPMYKINAKVLVQDDNPKTTTSSSILSSTGLQDFGGLLDIQSNVLNEVEIIQSKDILGKVVRGMNLTTEYYKQAGIRYAEMYHNSPFNVTFTPRNDSTPATVFNLLFENSGRGQKISIEYENAFTDTAFTGIFNDTLRLPLGKLYFSRTGMPFEEIPYQLKLFSVDGKVAEIVGNLLIENTNAQTTIMNLSYNSNLPKKGEDVVNRIVAEYSKRNLTEKNRISDSSIAFINSRISIVSDDLGKIEGQIQNFKQANKIADISEQSRVLIDNSSIYNDKLNQIDVQLSVANTTRNYLIDKSNNQRPVPYLINNDPTFLAIVQKYNELQVERDKVTLSISPDNPITQNLETQLANLRSDMNKSLDNQIRALNTSRNQIVAENASLRSMINNVPVQERQFVDLSREQSVKQALYLYLLQKKEETAITEASNLAGASIIASPKSDFLPYFPRTSLILAASFVLGLIIPSGIILLKSILHNRIISRDDISETTDAGILAEIGHSKTKLLSMKEEGRSMLAEQFRVFRTNMDFITGQKKCSKILITSSMSGEGKSFIAANLSQIYAYSGKKVLLMELDLRKPHISNLLGVSNERGFTNFVISGGAVEDFIKQLPNQQNISLLSSGPVPPNPAELLMSPVVNEMFEYASNNFDIVIVDSPPIGLVIDTQVLAKHSDVNLFVVRENVTFKNNLEIVNDLLENKKFPNLYIVVNDVKKGASYKYGYGHGYSYGHGYGFGYYGTEKPSKWLFWKKK